MDTTPLAQVTDAYLLINHAEVKVMVARYNYTIKKVFSLVMKDLSQKNIDHVCIVLNDNRYNRDQYGYGYGYNNKADQRKRERSLHRDNAIIQAVARSRKS
jgi:Mrp family chromosome partitioning ATPase